MDFRTAAEQIFLAGIESVLPDRLICKHVMIKDPTLFISSVDNFKLRSDARLTGRAGNAHASPDSYRDPFGSASLMGISSLQFPLNAIPRIFVIGAGKASALMAKEIENILGDRITEGHVVVKYGYACQLKFITVSEAGHPVPDNNGYLATQKILAIAKKASANDLIICLLSGGGSSLLADVPEGGTLHDLILTNDLLLKSGADIKEINT